MTWRAIRARDVVAALVLAVLAPVATLGADQRTTVDRSVDAVAVAAVAVAACALAAWRPWPLAVLAVTASVTSAYLWAGYPYGPVLVVYAVAVYGVARRLPLRRGVPAAAVALVVTLAHLVTNAAAIPGWLGLLPGSAWTVVPFAVGVSVRLWREGQERERAQMLREHADAERLRVAREVHDVVGHGLAAISMQANVALHVLPRDPSRAEEALRAISESSAAALQELRSTLAAVRDGDDAPRRPAPGLDRLPELFDRMRRAGMRVDVTVRGERRPLTAAAGLAAYRVVQEALTNALRHGSSPWAAVSVTYDATGVRIDVSNPAAGPVAASDGGGLGLPGMAERVAAVGGTLEASRAEPDGFGVRAWIPWREDG